MWKDIRPLILIGPDGSLSCWEKINQRIVGSRSLKKKRVDSQIVASQKNDIW